MVRHSSGLVGLTLGFVYFFWVRACITITSGSGPGFDCACWSILKSAVPQRVVAIHCNSIDQGCVNVYILPDALHRL
jgi:hypothetical protein